MLRYLKISQLATDAIFGWFLLSWLVTRHFLFISVIKSAIYDAPRLIKYEWSVERGHFLTKTALGAFCTMLLALEVGPLCFFKIAARTYVTVSPVDAMYMVLDDMSCGLARGFRQGCY